MVPKSEAQLGQGDSGGAVYFYINVYINICVFYIFIFIFDVGEGGLRGEESPCGSLEWCDRLPSLLVGFVGM